MEKGITSMMTQDVKTLKLCYLTAEIGKHSEYKESERVHCDHCAGTGNISMSDSQGYSWSMCCICSTGRRIAEAQGAPKWNGTNTQQGKTGLLTIPGAKSESQPAIYARGCAPDKDSVGDVLSGVVEGGRFTDRATSLEVRGEPIVWEE
jgi:hypothetical protein